MSLLGLAALLSRWNAGAPGTMIVRYALFAAFALVVCRVRDRARSGWLLAACCGLVAVMTLPFSRSAAVVTLVGAAAEELVFRRELPDAVGRLLAESCGSAGTLLGTVVAQLAFAACHLVVAGSAAMPSPGIWFLWLTVCGASLWVVYRATGTLAVPIAGHFWINQAGRFGSGGVLGARAAKSLLLGAAVSIVATTMYVERRRRRAPACPEGDRRTPH